MPTRWRTQAVSERPTGTVTFLFTDIEGSTKRWEVHPDAMRSALARHNAILRGAIEAYGGYIFKTVGDAYCAAFSSPHNALSAALSTQHALQEETWPEETGSIAVRMALHTGAVEEQEGDYFGQPLNRVARLVSAGYGGQVLLTRASAELVRDSLPGVNLLDMGEHRLKDLISPEHIFQAVESGLPSHFPPLKTLDNRPNNLHLQITPLIGRERELTQLKEVLSYEDVRLVTLTGPGGMGKTRLALQVASDLLDEFPDGVWLVELAALTEPKLVVTTVAAVLGVKEVGSIPIIDTLKEYLRDKNLLLVLDNFEQVVEAGREVSLLIAACPNLKVLTTSRIPLHIRGEKEYSVPSLSTPDIGYLRPLPPLESLTQYEAVRLFIERATDVKPDFLLTNNNAQAVVEICARLDGLPLAIELAAARTKLFPPQALLSRLSSTLSGRLNLLTGGARDLPARHQTLRRTIEWSYDLLSEGEKQLFWRMAPFSGGRTLEALEEVCNYDRKLQMDLFDGAQSLIDNSLLLQREGQDGEPRFWMLETIHEYAMEKLEESGEGEALHKEHALYMMRLAEEAEHHLVGAKQQEWLDHLEAEHDNIRAALRWTMESKEGRHKEAQPGEDEDDEAAPIHIGLRIGGAVGRFWSVRGHFSEGRAQLNELLEMEKVRGAQAAKANMVESSANERQTREAYTKRKAISAKVLDWAGMLASQQGEPARARSLFEESLAIGRELGDKRGIASSLHNLGNLVWDQGDYALARSISEESLAIGRELGDKRGIASSLHNLGNVVADQGDYASARALFEESLAIRRELGDKRGIAISLNNLGAVALDQQDYTSACSLFEESLAIRRELGDKRGIGLLLSNLGAVALAQGDYASARALFEESSDYSAGTGR